MTHRVFVRDPRMNVGPGCPSRAFLRSGLLLYRADYRLKGIDVVARMGWSNSGERRRVNSGER